MSWRRSDATRLTSDAFTSREGRTLAKPEHRNVQVRSFNHNRLGLIQRHVNEGNGREAAMNIARHTLLANGRLLTAIRK
jgi:hypothetical protein